MARISRRGGAGCALAVLALIVAGGLFISYKFGLLWWKKSDAPPPASGKELQVHILDVGQGDSILIISPEGKSVLVDAGEASRAKLVIDALNRYNVQKLDYFIATHTHPDHLGGAAEVIKAKGVATVIESGAPLAENEVSLTPSNPPSNQKGKKAPPAPVVRRPVNEDKLPNRKADTEFHAAVEQAGAQVVKAAPGQKYDLGGGARLVVLAPIQPFFTKDNMREGGNEPNANSVVVRLDYGEFSMWLAGDAEAQTEGRIMGAEQDDVTGKILKVAHHGSAYATSDAFLKRLKPEVGIISVGDPNNYGHPERKLLERLKNAGIAQLYRTDLQGEITITTTGKVRDGKLYAITAAKEAKAEDLWASPEDKKPQHKDDASRAGFIAYPATNPPRTPPGPKKK